MKTEGPRWDRFAERSRIDASVPAPILASWRRSEAAGLRRREFTQYRVPDSELSKRIEAAGAMLAIAKRHIDSISDVIGEVRHVAYMTDADGIVLYARGDAQQRAQFGLEPGFDWSERRMGTNGAGTAIAGDAVVAVVGPEHYLDAFDDCTCTAAPIHSPDGKVIGAIDVSSSVADAGPERLALVAYAARMIDHELALRDEVQQKTAYRATTERLREREKQLEQLNAELLAILDNTPAVVYLVDPENRFLRINKRWGALFGLSNEVVAGKSVGEFFPPETAEMFYANNRDVWASARPREFEETVRQGDNARTYLSIKVPIYDAAGEPWALCGISTDITDRKAAEAQARRHARELQRLGDAALQMHTTHDARVLLQLATDAAREIVGAHFAVTIFAPDRAWRDAVLARSVSEEYAAWRDYDPLPHGAAVDALVSAAQRPQRLTQAALLAHPAWQVFGVQAGKRPPLCGWLAAPLRAGNGENLGLVQLSAGYEGEFTAADEAVLVQLTQVASIALENAMLYHKLQDTNARKDRFLAMLAHELRNPLAPMRNAAFALSKTKIRNATVTWAANVFARQVGQLTRLVDDLLDLSRIESGKIRLEKATVNAGDIAQQALETSRPLFEAKEQVLVVDLAGADVMLHVDATRVAQALANLLNNAAKYTPPGGNIWFSAVTEAGQIAFRVKDTGAGIPADATQKIFEPFMQVEDSRAASQGGLGIGLWLVKTVAALHQGTVDVKSEGAGRGSEFELRLPLLRGGATAPPPTPSEAAGDIPTLRILVVDDNADAADSFSLVLEMLRQEVRVVYDGERALEMIDTWRPDVVFLDIGLPGMSGFEVAARVKARANNTALLVALTGYGSTEDRARALAAGFDMHVVKPVDPERLRALLRMGARAAATHIADVAHSNSGSG